MLALDNPAIPLSFVAGPAILANVRAILQKGMNIRHSHSVDQWRRFHAWPVSDDGEFGRCAHRLMLLHPGYAPVRAARPGEAQ
jgi:hypothetical protein